MKVKMCGMTNVADALDAAEAGADSVGFIFVKTSPRYVTPETARDIIQKLPPDVIPVGVFANERRASILDIRDRTGIRCLQLHGDETPEECSGFPVPVYKAFRVGGDFRVEVLGTFDAAAYLLDTYRNGSYGGTGQTFDWNVAVAAKQFGKIVLSGGLTPENIGDAIRIVHPHGVDVSSGVESSPGKKDKNKMKEFVRRVQEAACL